jgi:hypothetical protein
MSSNIAFVLINKEKKI